MLAPGLLTSVPLPPRLGERGSHTLQRGWLADQQPGEQGCARQSREAGQEAAPFILPLCLADGRPLQDGTSAGYTPVLNSLTGLHAINDR